MQMDLIRKSFLTPGDLLKGSEIGSRIHMHAINGDLDVCDVCDWLINAELVAFHTWLHSVVRLLSLFRHFEDDVGQIVSPHH